MTGLLGAVENVIPPIPADTVIALVAFLSQGGELSALNIFLVAWSANVVSASIVYAVARKYGRPLFSGRIGRRLLKPHHFTRLEVLYREHGTWGIFASRFIPGVRAVISPFAGIAGLGPAIVGSGIWYAGLVYAAAKVAQEFDPILLVVRRVNSWALVILAIAAVSGIVAWQFKRGKSSD